MRWVEVQAAFWDQDVSELERLGMEDKRSFSFSPLTIDLDFIYSFNEGTVEGTTCVRTRDGDSFQVKESYEDFKRRF